MKKKCLVTGGAGFIGSNLAEALLNQGYAVRVLDSFVSGSRENLTAIQPQIEILEGDLRDETLIRQAVQGIDTVFHLAAVASVVRSVENPRETHEVNVSGTWNLLEQARNAGVRRLVFSSSSAVYGDSEDFPLKEETKLRPLSPYAISKLIGEQYCGLFQNLYHLETVSLRYFNVYGKRQNPDSEYSGVIPRLLDRLLEGQSPVIYGDGRQSRDFIYVEDVVQANLQAASVPAAAGKTFNIATQQENSVLDILEQLVQILKIAKPAVDFQPRRAGDVYRSVADTSRAQRELDFHPGTGFRAGLEKTVQWFQTGRQERKPQA